MNKLALIVASFALSLFSTVYAQSFNQIASTSDWLLIVRIGRAQAIPIQSYNPNIHVQPAPGSAYSNPEFYTLASATLLKTVLHRTNVLDVASLSICARQMLKAGERYVVFLTKQVSKTCQFVGSFYPLEELRVAESGLGVELTEDNALTFPKGISLIHSGFSFQDASKGPMDGTSDIMRGFVDLDGFVALAKTAFFDVKQK